MSDLTLAERSIELVRAWIDPAHVTRRRPERGAERLAAVLDDPHGSEFTIAFLDRVIRSEDVRVAATTLRRLARDLPESMPPAQRLLLRTGGIMSRLAPHLVVRIARTVLGQLLGHLVVDAAPATLTRSIKRLGAGGDRVNLILLGEAVLGDAEATRRRDAVVALLDRDDVDRVSVKISSVTAQLSLWSFDDSVARVVKQLTPLLDKAAEVGAFVTLEPSHLPGLKGLDLTVAAFTTALDDFPDLEAGLVVQVYLKDSLATVERLHTWAAARRAAGGAPITVRLVKGANLAMERVESTLSGHALPTWGSKVETDASYKRLLDHLLTPERTDAVKVGVAGQNLFDLAYAWLLAGDRDVQDAVHLEALLGMDTGPLDAVREVVGPLTVYTPVVPSGDPHAAVPYLVRRVEELASTDHFMSAALDLDDPSLLAREAQRFLESVRLLDDEPEPADVQDRADPVPEQDRDDRSFTNAPDTDPSVADNRAWAHRAVDRAEYSQLGTESVRAARVPGPASLEDLIQRTRDGGAAWDARGAEVRAWTLHQAGRALAARRSELIAVMVAETGMSVADADTEVSTAVDLAHYYAESGRRLHAVDGARFEPVRLTAAVPAWSEPAAGPAGQALAALASGSGVIVSPAPQAPRCAAVVCEALWQAGVPRDALRLAKLDDGPLGKALVAHSDVNQVLLSGAWSTATLFRSWRPQQRLLAATSGKNAIVVTPAADLDRAVDDVVRSAFGRVGQDASAVSLAILVGSVGESEHFRRQLVDAVSSLRLGPLVEPVSETQRAGLTELHPGETWLVRPTHVGTDERLWTPGIRDGVQPGGWFHHTEYFAPVLGLMRAATLEQAIEWQNATDFGLVAGLHSLDPHEVNQWLESVEAGSLVVNRPTTGAVVQRRPVVGWRRASAGPTAATGGPNLLAHLGSWHPRPVRRVAEPAILEPEVLDLIDAARPHLTATEITQIEAAATSDEVAWRREFGVEKDVAALGVERNVLRYLPGAVEARLEGASLVEVLRVRLAALRAGADVTVSVDRALPIDLGTRVETTDAWTARMVADRPDRIRLVGGDPVALALALEGDPEVAVHTGAVTWSGRIEMLAFLYEQSVSITMHRFGALDPSFRAVLPR